MRFPFVIVTPDELSDQQPFCPIPRVFLTINNFVEGKRMSEKKWGVGGSSVVGAVYYYCMDLEGRQVRSNGVVETALFFDAERRRLVAADVRMGNLRLELARYG